MAPRLIEKSIRALLTCHNMCLLDLGGYYFVVLELRNVINRRDFVVAEMIGSGRYATMTGAMVAKLKSSFLWKKGNEAMEVIVAATYNAAELLDIQSDYGSIEEGK